MKGDARYKKFSNLLLPIVTELEQLKAYLDGRDARRAQLRAAEEAAQARAREATNRPKTQKKRNLY